MVDESTPNHFHLSDILLEVKNDILPKAQGKSLMCRTLLANNAPNCLQGDPHSLFQRLRNMAHQSVEAIDRGCIQIVIEALDMTAGDALLQFSITVSGKDGDTRYHPPLNATTSPRSLHIPGFGERPGLDNRLVGTMAKNRSLSFTQRFPVCVECDCKSIRCSLQSARFNRFLLLGEPSSQKHFERGNF